MRVLDVGSGAGDVAVLLASLVGPGGEVIGTAPHGPQLMPQKNGFARPVCGTQIPTWRPGVNDLR
jgi:hypothetical protein